MSRASRKFSRRALPRRQTIELEVDKEWTDRVDLLGRKLVVASQHWSALVGEAASTLGMTRDDAGDLIDRYMEETEENGHEEALIDWLARAINEEYGSVPLHANSTEPLEHGQTKGTMRSGPELTLVIKHPPGWCAHEAVTGGAKVTMTMTMYAETPDARRFPMHAEMPETATEDDLRAVVGMTLDYLCMTWELHGKVLEAFRSSDNWGRPEPSGELLD